MVTGFRESLTKAFTGATPEDDKQFKEYQRRGGPLSFHLWKQLGKPTPPAQLTPRTREIAEQVGERAPGFSFDPETPQERVQRGIPIRQAEGVLGGLGGLSDSVTGGVSRGTAGFTGLKFPPQPTQPPPPGFRWSPDPDLNRWVPERIPEPPSLTPFQEQQLQGFPEPTDSASGRISELQRLLGGSAPQQERIPFEQELAGLQAGGGQTRQPPTDAFGRQGIWNPRTGQYDFPPTFGQRPVDQPAPLSEFPQRGFDVPTSQQDQAQEQFQAQLAFQQQQAQAATELQERQFASQLSANPINWLQFAAFTGQQPVIQPWMVPLGFQNTGGNISPQGLQAGQPISGFQPTGGTATATGSVGNQTFGNLPQLTTPSAQLQARWGPTAQAQFLGFERARTGASPSETQFRLGSGRAPSGQFGGFSRFR